MKKLLYLVFVLMIALTGIANADITGTYVDADDTTTSLADGSGGEWYKTTDTANYWWYRSFADVTEDDDIFQLSPLATSPELITTITGLTAGDLYDVSVVFVGKSDTNYPWNVTAGLTAGSLTAYKYGDGVSVATGKTAQEGALVQLQAPLGTATADANGEINVYICHAVFSSSSDCRAWYDGVAYEAAAVPEPGTLALLLFGALSLIGVRRRDK